MDWLVNILNERSFTNEQQCTIERYIKILFHENMKWYVKDQWNDKCIWNKIGFGNERFIGMTMWNFEGDQMRTCLLTCAWVR